MSRVNKLKDHKLKLNVGGTDIKSYDSITLLGVDIDNALNFSGHISNTCKKSSQWVGVIINRLRFSYHKMPSYNSLRVLFYLI